MEFFDQHRIITGHKVLLPGSGVNLRHHYLQEYPAQNNPVRFVFISRLLREKGIEEYLNAAVLVKSKRPDVEFHILGRSEGSYEERVRELQDKGIVSYHGVVVDVRPFIGKCHCTIHPSYYPEGMSNVLLESCAAGRPVITTNRPGCGEVVDDGITGYIVNDRDVESLVEIIEKFIDLPYEQKVQMGREARRKVEHDFDRQIVIDKYCEEIREL